MSATLSPERFQHTVRAHWAIENCLHWVLDVTMNEDRQRNRKGHGPENLAMLRRLALNIARREPTRDAMRGKLKRAAWNDDFLLTMIADALFVADYDLLYCIRSIISILKLGNFLHGHQSPVSTPRLLQFPATVRTGILGVSIPVSANSCYGPRGIRRRSRPLIPSSRHR